jgi:hypothetical protein
MVEFRSEDGATCGEIPADLFLTVEGNSNNQRGANLRAQLDSTKMTAKTI